MGLKLGRNRELTTSRLARIERHPKYVLCVMHPRRRRRVAPASGPACRLAYARSEPQPEVNRGKRQVE
jgi:hypothetical protein